MFYSSLVITVFKGKAEILYIHREELTFEMLSLEPRASDDETLESEASIGTADSSENLNVDSEGATSDFSGKFLWTSREWAALWDAVCVCCLLRVPPLLPYRERPSTGLHPTQEVRGQGEEDFTETAWLAGLGGLRLHSFIRLLLSSSPCHRVPPLPSALQISLARAVPLRPRRWGPGRVWSAG